MNVHEACLDDIHILAVHYRKMFEEICERGAAPLDNATAAELESSYADKLVRQMPSETCKAWVIKDNGRIIASGAITIVSFVPVPADVNHNVAYLHSMYTEQAHRNKGCAHHIVDRALHYCRHRGINRVVLTTSDAGKSIYEEKGFVSAPEMMRVFIT